MIKKKLNEIRKIFNNQIKKHKKKRIIKNFKEFPRYLNIGGERFVKEDWRILDYITPHSNYDPVFIDFNINLEKHKKWAIKTESYNLVYCSHTLEHLSPDSVDWTLKETHRILKSKGGIRIVVPDIDLFLSHYKLDDFVWLETKYPKKNIEKLFLNLKKITIEDILLWLFATHLLGKISSLEVKKNFNLMSKINFLDKYINLIQDPHQKNTNFHRNWFDYKKLEKLLTKAGFSHIIKSHYRQSIFAELLDEEFDKSSPEIAFFVDAIK